MDINHIDFESLRLLDDAARVLAKFGVRPFEFLINYGQDLIAESRLRAHGGGDPEAMVSIWAKKLYDSIRDSLAYTLKGKFMETLVDSDELKEMRSEAATRAMLLRIRKASELSEAASRGGWVPVVLLCAQQRRGPTILPGALPSRGNYRLLAGPWLQQGSRVLASARTAIEKAFKGSE